MNIFEETMKYFEFKPYQYTKEEKEELKRDVEFEQWLDEQQMKSEKQQNEEVEND